MTDLTAHHPPKSARKLLLYVCLLDNRVKPIGEAFLFCLVMLGKEGGLLPAAYLLGRSHTLQSKLGDGAD